MQSGNLELIDTGDRHVFAFRRVAAGDQVTVAVNLAAAPATVALPGEAPFALTGWGWRITPAQ